jgi:hypothetical protein
MTEYINKQTLLAEYDRVHAGPAGGARKLIEEAPAADVVPVVWLPVLGFEGLYEVSSLGQLRNKKGEIMKQGIKRTPCTCYKVVRLWKEGTYYTKYVHRLIAEAFIPNPDNLPMINHKDEDGTNNLIGNLEWCTREYNVNYGTAKERRAKKIRGRESEKRVAVIGRTIDGKYEEWFPSIAEAAKVVNGSTSSISKVCKGERKTAYGYRWAYADNHLPNCGSDMRGSFQNGNNHTKDWPSYMDLPRGRKDGE